MSRALMTVFMSLSILSASAFAGECPADFGTSEDYVGDVVKAIEASRGQCGKAAAIAAACAMGSSMDGAIAGAAQGVCEAKFASQMTKVEAKGYASLVGRCGKKYDHLEGTINRSFSAFCKLEIAQSYAKTFYSLALPVQN